MRLIASNVLVATALLAPLSASAETAEETAAVFGMRQSILDISLSPSGNKIAFVSPIGESTEMVYVVNLTGAPTPVPITKFSDENGRLSQCNWATEERLVCEVHLTTDQAGMLLGFTRIFSISANGGKPQMLTERTSSRAVGMRQDGGDVLSLDLDGESDKILMTRQWVKEETVGTRLANDLEGLGVDKVDVVTGRRASVERPDSNAVGYIADENGRVRIKIRQPDLNSGMLSNQLFFYFRTADSDNWELLSKVEVDSQTYSGLYPVAVDSAQNVAYAFAYQSGFEALYVIPLEAGGVPRLLLSQSDADVDQLIRVGRKQRFVGASYATEKRQITYLDAELKKLADQLHSALPGKPLITIAGASADESRLLIIASSDTDPGMTYLYDKASRRLQPLLPLREYMNDRAMGTMTPMVFPAADGTMIPGYLTMPPESPGRNIPAIVLPHGGPSSRDEWGFDWLVQFFSARGYAVLQPNFRGSSGFGSDWFGRNGFQAWRTAIADVNDAGRWLVSQGIADPERLAVVGWSYGGYAALQSQALDPSLYKAVVAIAPVADLEQLRRESMRYTTGKLVEAFIGEGRHVTEGSPARNASAFKSPVLLFHGNLDQNVDIAQSRLMRDRLRDAGKQVMLIEFRNVAHSLDESKVRFEMLKQIDGFLNVNLAR